MKKIKIVSLLLVLGLCLNMSAIVSSAKSYHTDSLDKLFTKKNSGTTVTVYGRKDGITLREGFMGGIHLINGKTYRFAENGLDSYLVEIKGKTDNIDIKVPNCIDKPHKLSKNYYELTGKWLGSGTVSVINTSNSKAIASFKVIVHKEVNATWSITGFGTATVDRNGLNISSKEWKENKVYTIKAKKDEEYLFLAQINDSYHNVCLVSCDSYDYKYVFNDPQVQHTGVLKPNMAFDQVKLKFTKQGETKIKLAICYIDLNDREVKKDVVIIKANIE